MTYWDLIWSPSLQRRLTNKHADVLTALTKEGRFTSDELQNLLILYYKLNEKGPMDIYRFKYILHKALNMTNDLLNDKIFRMYDKGKQVISVEDWLSLMTLFLRSTIEEKARHCFTVYDMYNEGFLIKRRMIALLKECIIVSNAMGEEEQVERVKELADTIIKSTDGDRFGKIQFHDYLKIVKKNVNNLEFLGQCLPERAKTHAFMLSLTTKPLALYFF